MTAEPQEVEPGHRSLDWVVWYWQHEMQVPYTDQHLRLARGYEDGSLAGTPVLIPLPMFPRSLWEAPIYGVDKASDPLTMARPMVMPWIADIIDPRQEENMFEDVWYQTGQFRGLGDYQVNAPQLLVVPRDMDMLTDSGIHIALSDVAFAAPRVVRDWDYTWRSAWHGSEDAFFMTMLVDYLETGEPEYFLGTDKMDEMEALYESSPHLQEKFGDFMTYVFEQIGQIERTLTNDAGDCWVNPIAAQIDKQAAFALHRAYDRLRTDSQPIWEAIASRFRIHLEMEGYPWA